MVPIAHFLFDIYCIFFLVSKVPPLELEGVGTDARIHSQHIILRICKYDTRYDIIQFLFSMLYSTEKFNNTAKKVNITPSNHPIVPLKLRNISKEFLFRNKPLNVELGALHATIFICSI